LVKHAGKTGRPRRGGRPSLDEAAQIRERILASATGLFFAAGYGAVSIEAVAKHVRMSKRTFYHRFRDKQELFKAVVHRVIEHLKPPGPLPTLATGDPGKTLNGLARMILQASLKPEAVALQRLILAEAARFPELAAAVNEVGARQQAITMIADYLTRETGAGNLTVKNPAFAAEQFLHLIIAAPQRRAFGLGAPMGQRELDAWARDAVGLFLDGCRK